MARNSSSGRRRSRLAYSAAPGRRSVARGQIQHVPPSRGVNAALVATWDADCWRREEPGTLSPHAPRARRSVAHAAPDMRLSELVPRPLEQDSILAKPC